MNISHEEGGAGGPSHASLYQQRALVGAHCPLRPEERIVDHLHDVYVVCSKERVDDVHHIQVHHGRTQVWDRAGVWPQTCVN